MPPGHTKPFVHAWGEERVTGEAWGQKNFAGQGTITLALLLLLELPVEHQYPAGHNALASTRLPSAHQDGTMHAVGTLVPFWGQYDPAGQTKGIADCRGQYEPAGQGLEAMSRKSV